jgi:hypothetical protein
MNTHEPSRHFDLCVVLTTAVRTVSAVPDVRTVLRSVRYGRSRSRPVFPFTFYPQEHRCDATDGLRFPSILADFV